MRPLETYQTKHVLHLFFSDAAQAVLAEVAAIMNSIGESHGKVLPIAICRSVSTRLLSFFFLICG
jgi:hypothetical protein